MGCVLVPEETSIGWAWRNPQGLAASILCRSAGVTSRRRRSFGLSHVPIFAGTGESSNLGDLKGGGGTGRVLPPTGPLGSMDPSGLERLVAGGITVLSWFPAARRHWDADSGMPWLVQVLDYIFSRRVRFLFDFAVLGYWFSWRVGFSLFSWRVGFFVVFVVVRHRHRLIVILIILRSHFGSRHRGACTRLTSSNHNWHSSAHSCHEFLHGARQSCHSSGQSWQSSGHSCNFNGQIWHDFLYELLHRPKHWC